MENTDFTTENVSAGIFRDFPSGFGNLSGSSKGFSTKFVHSSRDFPPGFGPNVPVCSQMEREKGFRNGKAFYWRRQVGAVKSKVGIGGKCDEIMVKDPKKMKVKYDETMVKDPNKMKRKYPFEKGTEMGSCSCDEGKRAEVLELLKLFRDRCEKISRNGEGVVRVDYRAKKELTNEGIIRKKCPSCVGHVPGVEIGDKFRYRVEMMIIGLHTHLERGIDCKVHCGKYVATCIVATEGYSDKMNDSETLTYVGEGRLNKQKLPCDQTLTGGNLALWNSMKVKSPVRVVRGFKTDMYDCVRKRVVPRTNYIYDGLYEVRRCEKRIGPLRTIVFEFKLSRCPGQPTVASKGWKRNRT